MWFVVWHDNYGNNTPSQSAINFQILKEKWLARVILSLCFYLFSKKTIQPKLLSRSGYFLGKIYFIWKLWSWVMYVRACLHAYLLWRTLNIFVFFNPSHFVFVKWNLTLFTKDTVKQAVFTVLIISLFWQLATTWSIKELTEYFLFIITHLTFQLCRSCKSPHKSLP